MNCISSMFTVAAGAAGLGSTLENLWSGRSKAGGSEVGWGGGVVGMVDNMVTSRCCLWGPCMEGGVAPTAGDQPCRHIAITTAIC